MAFDEPSEAVMINEFQLQLRTADQLKRDESHRKVVENDPIIRTIELLNTLMVEKKDGKVITDVKVTFHSEGDVGVTRTVDGKVVGTQIGVWLNKEDADEVERLVDIFNRQEEATPGDPSSN